MNAVFVRNYIRKLSMNTRMGFRGKYKAGTVSGIASFGYKLEGPKGKKIPVINETEAEVVRHIFDLYINGPGGVPSVAATLRDEGHITRSGKPWSESSVYTILTNSVYIGAGYYGVRQHYTTDNGIKDVHHSRPTDPDTWIKVSYPVIIDEKTFQKAQERRKHQRRKRKNTTGEEYMLRGLLWCNDCGRKFTVNTKSVYRTWKRKDGTNMRRKAAETIKRRRYVCHSFKQRGIDCNRRSIGAKTIEGKVWAAIKDFLTNPARVTALLEDNRKALKENGTLPSLEKASRQLEDAKQQEARAMDLYLEGRFDRDYLEMKIKQLRERREYYEDEINRLESESAEALETIEVLTSFVDASPRILAELDTMSEEERVRYARRFIERVTLDEPTEDNPDGIDFVMKIPKGLYVGRDLTATSRS